MIAIDPTVSAAITYAYTAIMGGVGVTGFIALAASYIQERREDRAHRSRKEKTQP